MSKEYLLDTNAYYNLLKESRLQQKGSSAFSVEINTLANSCLSLLSQKLKLSLSWGNMPVETAVVFKNVHVLFPLQEIFARTSGMLPPEHAGAGAKSTAGSS